MCGVWVGLCEGGWDVWYTSGSWNVVSETFAGVGAKEWAESLRALHIVDFLCYTSRPPTATFSSCWLAVAFAAVLALRGAYTPAPGALNWQFPGRFVVIYVFMLLLPPKQGVILIASDILSLLTLLLRHCCSCRLQTFAAAAAGGGGGWIFIFFSDSCHFVRN